MKKKVMFTFLAILVFASALAGVSAFEDSYCVDVSVTDINPSSVGLEEEITVGLLIDNCGSKLPEMVRFEITRFSEEIIIKEPLVVEFDKPFGYANSKRFNVYHLYVTNDASPGEYVFEYELSYGGTGSEITKKGNFSITVSSEKADLNVAYVKTDPLLPREDQETTLTIRLENFGNGDANSVKASIDVPFFGIREAFLGELESGDDSSAVFTIIPDRSGIINYNLTVKYKDDFGEHEFIENLELNIQQDDRKSNFITIMGAIILILLIGGAIYYFVFRNPNKIKKNN